MRNLFPLVAVAATLAGCQQPSRVHADHAYVRLPAVAGRPAVAYFTIHGGPADTVLLSVTSPVVIRTELHESMTGAGNMAHMAPIKSVAVPAGTSIAFAPGGRHAMLFNVNPSVLPGSNVQLLLTFTDNTRLSVTAPVVAAGDPAPY